MKGMNRRLFLSLAAPGIVPFPASAAIASPQPPLLDALFWKYWGDGQAELSGYDLAFPRYGQLRRGTAVTIFVTEPFSNSARVKADAGKHPPGDEFPAMKLNLIEDYQTGIYDYHDMTSTFVALAPVNGRPAGSAVKISFSCQEWCGQTYQQLLFDANGIRSAAHSYFDGEGDRQGPIAYPGDGISEDQLLLWARGQAGPRLAPGEKREVQLLMSLQAARQQHVPIEWRRAQLSRSAGQQQLSVAAGKFAVEMWSATVPGGTTRSIYVEAAQPRRIVRWESSTGERADLLGSGRMKYWEMNREGYESALQKLGLSRRPSRTT
jgi:hypothetical protein